LARDPFCCWILRHANPDQLSPVQPDYDESIGQAEVDGWDNEQSMAAMSGARFCKKVRRP
jgi:hypothetical protein